MTLKAVLDFNLNDLDTAQKDKLLEQIYQHGVDPSLHIEGLTKAIDQYQAGIISSFEFFKKVTNISNWMFRDYIDAIGQPF